jgi:hypothetical protein
MKRCSKCGETKSLDSFGVHTRTKSGLNAHCKECRAAISRASRRDPAKLLRKLARLRENDLIPQADE